jgi:hypothetical protein
VQQSEEKGLGLEIDSGGVITGIRVAISQLKATVKVGMSYSMNPVGTMPLRYGTTKAPARGRRAGRPSKNDVQRIHLVVLVTGGGAVRCSGTSISGMAFSSRHTQFFAPDGPNVVILLCKTCRLRNMEGLEAEGTG